MKKEDIKKRTIALYHQRQEGDRSLRLLNQIYSLNEGLANWIARSFADNTYVPFDDLRQEAQLALWLAIPRFELSRGVAFSAFVKPYIHGKLQHYLRDKALLVKCRANYERVSTVLSLAKKPTNALLSPADIAACKYGWDEVEWQRALASTQRANTSSLDVADDCPIKSGSDPMSTVLSQDARDRHLTITAQLLSRLPQPDRTWVKLHQINGMKMNAIATLYGTSPAKVSKAIKCAIAQFQGVAA